MDTMDTTTIIIIVVVLALIAMWFYNRNKPAPRGTYDDKDVRSSGSIGGGTRAHDNPDVRSSGSIGGGTRAHDAPEHSSGGSIGGRQQTENSRIPQPSTRPQQQSTPPPERPINSDLGPLETRARGDTTNGEPDEERQRDEFRSSGSFGGSRN